MNLAIYVLLEVLVNFRLKASTFNKKLQAKGTNLALSTPDTPRPHPCPQPPPCLG